MRNSHLWVDPVKEISDQKSEGRGEGSASDVDGSKDLLVLVPSEVRLDDLDQMEEHPF